MTCVASAVMLAVFAFQFENIQPLEPLEPLVRQVEGSTLAPLLPDAPSEAEDLDLLPLGNPGVHEEPEVKYGPGTELYVAASSLAYRKGPGRKGILIRYLPRDSKVTVLYDVLDPIAYTIEGMEGHWMYVQFGSYKGYVFDGYLARTPPSLDKMLDWTCVPGERVGPITYDTSLELLEGIFGNANVTDAEYPLGEGETEPGTAIFADDPEKALLVQWEVYKEVPQAVMVLGHKWKTSRGIALGTRLSSLVAMNGGPISFAGFGWDYSGFVTSWRSGALEEDHPLRKGIALNLTPVKPYLPADYRKVVGETEYSSDLPAARKLNVEVDRMVIVLNRLED